MTRTYPRDWFDFIRPGFVWWVQTELDRAGSRNQDPWTVALTQQDGDGRRAMHPTRPSAQITFIGIPQNESRMVSTFEDVSATRMDHHTDVMKAGTVQVEVFSAHDEIVAIEELRASVNRVYPTQEGLRSAGIVVLEALGTPRDLSDLVGGEYEYRYVLEFPYRVSQRSTLQDYPWIETVNFGDPVVEVN